MLLVSGGAKEKSGGRTGLDMKFVAEGNPDTSKTCGFQKSVKGQVGAAIVGEVDA